MPPPKKSARSIWPSLLIAALACALPACKRNSTRPYVPPTPPPTISCDQTPPPAHLPPLPPLSTPPGQMLAAMDQWVLAAIGVYAGEVTIRRGEHACMRDLRERGVIR